MLYVKMEIMYIKELLIMCIIYFQALKVNMLSEYYHFHFTTLVSETLFAL